MKSFTVTAFGEPACFQDQPIPSPERGEILVRIEACGLNFADLLMQKGEYQDTPPLPFAPGLEICGTVEALGPETKGPAPGTRVALFGGVRVHLASSCTQCHDMDRGRPLEKAI